MDMVEIQIDSTDAADDEFIPVNDIFETLG